MQKYTLFYLDQLGYRGTSLSEKDNDGEWYLASDVDDWIKKMMLDTEESNLQALHTRIAELEKALRAASRWLHRNVLNDVMAPEMMTDTDGFSGEYLNDLADMRAVRELMGSERT